jgi:hypothetical protein
MNAHTEAEGGKRADKTGVSFVEGTTPSAGFYIFQASIW